MDEALDSVRARLRSTHRNVLVAIETSAEVTAAAWTGESVTERRRLVGPFREALADRAVFDALPAVLEDLVEVAGGELSVPAVGGPPYVVVTSTGVLLRATLPRGRLVVALEPFAVNREPTTTYVRRDELAIDVRWA